ncbi:unnamed protein product [Medioppia subpectinata]|uniref:MD-2-related lipid-recognition domain-containing protein n=1 Tax=Medioppia subpectinata TaxID=1979941 RepID=A0A7R9PVB1_9ACAR|nr:unnamed protein product [Medioppia subpectinata]CAG2102082.1 unnamed protein product [Medioppia subpectinata]
MYMVKTRATVRMNMFLFSPVRMALKSESMDGTLSGSVTRNLGPIPVHPQWPANPTRFELYPVTINKVSFPLWTISTSVTSPCPKYNLTSPMEMDNALHTGFTVCHKQVVKAGIQYTDCGHGEITSLQISGCTASPCLFTRGTDVTINIAYTANQNSTTAIWYLHAIVGVLDLDLADLIPGFDSNGCHDTPCPVTIGQNKQFTYKLNIPSTFPAPLQATLKARLIVK